MLKTQVPTAPPEEVEEDPDSDVIDIIASDAEQ